MQTLSLVRSFGSDWYCPSVSSPPDPNIRRHMTLSWGIQEIPQNPLWQVFQWARNKFFSIITPWYLDWDLPQAFPESLRDVLSEYWYAVLVERKVSWPRQVLFTAQLDMQLGSIAKTSALVQDLSGKVKKFWHIPKMCWFSGVSQNVLALRWLL